MPQLTSKKYCIIHTSKVLNASNISNLATKFHYTCQKISTII